MANTQTEPKPGTGPPQPAAAVLGKPIYGIDERPRRWSECLLYGWQHTLVDISPFVLPLAVAAALGMNNTEVAQLINFGLFAMGIATLIQTTIGNRLPIIQGPSATLTSTLAPIAAWAGAPAMWGAVFAGALVEMALGIAGVFRFVKRAFPASVAGVVIVSIGLSLGKVAVRLSVGDGGASNFLYAAGVIAVILALHVGASELWGGILSRASIFIAIWLVGLGVGGLMGDVDWSLIASKPWWQAPTLFPYGGPGWGWEFSTAAFLGALAGYAGSMVESIGDYAATCSVSGETLRTRHLNRGIFAEGLGCAVASCLGGLPCTSYTQNIGIIATTRVASRVVVQVAALILMLYGLCPKFGALLAAMPRPVLGGVFLVVCGMITISGSQLLAQSSTHAGEALAAGLSLVVAIATPYYTTGVLGNEWLNSISVPARLLLTNTVALAVLGAVSLHLAGQALTPRRRSSLP